jgi:hypothetical protein
MKHSKLFFIVFIIFIGGALLGVGSMYLLFETIKTESITLPTKLNSTDIAPNIFLKKVHNISINGKNKAVWNSYQTKFADFVEGENTITIQRESKFGLKGAISEYSINVDRIAPILKITYNQPTELVNQSSVDIEIEQEPKSEIYVGDMYTILVNGKVNIPLQPGENTPDIRIKDEFGNLTKNQDFKITNLTGGQYQQSSCGDLIYTIDTSKVQLGYSGVENRPEVTNETDKYFAQANTAQCQTNSTKVPVYPLGSKAYCWNCDGGYSYISLTNQPNILNRPKVEKELVYPNVVKALEYDTKSGIKGDLVTQQQDINYTIENVPKQRKLQTFSFEFIHKETTYKVFASGDINLPKFANLEQDFMFFIDHLYTFGLNKIESNNHVDGSETKEFNDSSFGGMKLNYQSDWKLSLIKGNDYLPINGRPFDPSNILIAEKGVYSVSIFQTEKNKGGYCGLTFEDSNKKYYTEKEIDGQKLQIPLATVLKTQLGQGGDNNVIQVKQNENGLFVGNCKFTIGNFDYLISVLGGDKGKNVTEFDIKVEKEILDLLSSIKWGGV